MNKDFWKNKKVLITGNTGFVGTWLTKWLEMVGADVYGYSDDVPEDSPYATIYPKQREKDVFGDLCELEDAYYIKRLPSDIDIVFHLAAQAIVSEGYRRPNDTFFDNVMGTVCLYDYLLKHTAVKAIVTVTSDKCYVNDNSGKKFVETDPLGGKDPYSASKACQEIVSSCYRESFLKAKGVRLATARAGNIVGGGDMGKDRLIPDCVRAAARKEAVVLRNPNATRPFQYILDALHGYILLAEKLYESDEYEGAWNFAPFMSITAEEAVKAFYRWYPGMYEITKDDSFVEAKTLVLDSSKAREKLGWNPVYRTEQAVEVTAFNYKWWDKNRIDATIADYEGMLSGD